MKDIKAIITHCKTLRLLYVEDDTMVSRYTTDLLKTFFEDITLVQDGKQALESFKSNTYDIILTDINLPYMDGFELIQTVRSLDDKIPIIIISAYTDEENYEKALAYNIQGYLTKPLYLKSLIEALDPFCSASSPDK